MLDSKETIDGLEEINKRLGFKYDAICDAIKAIKMWERFIQRYGPYSISLGIDDAMSVRDLTDEVEEEFFPSLVSKTLIVKFNIPPEVPTKEFSTIRKLLERTRGVVVKTIRVEVDDDKEK